MGLLDKQKKEIKENYIRIDDFINLIAYTTNEYVDNIISYLVLNDFESKVTSYNIDRHKRIDKSLHIEEYGFDLKTREFIDGCGKLVFFSKYIEYTEVRSITEPFYYLKKDLKTIDFLNELNLNYEDLKVVEKFIDRIKADSKNPIYRYDFANFDHPNDIQLKFYKRDSFSVNEVACMLAGVSLHDIENFQNHPKFTETYEDFISYKKMIEKSIKNNTLKCEYLPLINYEHDVILKSDLELYLYEKGYVLKGFNDWLDIEPAKALKDEVNQNIKRDIVDLNTNYLSTILDESHPNHAPDLKHAINLWIDVYIKNSVGGESHSAMAENWIAKNTKYDAEVTKSDINSIKRIREVTTPLKDFGKGRSREDNK